MLSSIIPFEEANNSRIFSSLRLRLAFPREIYKMRSYFMLSTSGISILTTSARSYSSRPYSVTVKFMTVTLMNTSGRKWGLESLVEKNNLNLGSISSSVSPSLIILLLFTIVYYFSRRGSRVASRVSPISSISRGNPYLIAFSTFFRRPS